MGEIKKIFGVKEKTGNIMVRPERQNIEQTEDYAVKKVINLIEGTIEKAPSKNNDIVNKLYADSLTGGGGFPEGTSVKSTGETGGTKFLREDGDGTCSWQTVTHPSQVEDNITDGHTTVAPSGNAVYDALLTKVTSGGALGTPSGGTLTNCSGLTESGITTADNTTNDVSTSKHGFVPKAPNDTTKFLRGDATWAVPSSGSSFWTLMPGTPTRASNTTFTITGDYTSLIAKGMIIKWTESSTVRVAMVSIPSTYGAPNTTVTIIGDTMASIDASSLKYAMIGAEMFMQRFAVAGTIGATGSDVANAYYATEPMRVIGADLQVGTAGTTNSTTVDINKGGTTMFTTKPTLASTVATSSTPYTADTATSLALADKITIDVDAVQTTAAIDLYVQLYLFPTRYVNLT